MADDSGITVLSQPDTRNISFLSHGTTLSSRSFRFFCLGQVDTDSACCSRLAVDVISLFVHTNGDRFACSYRWLSVFQIDESGFRWSISWKAWTTTTTPFYTRACREEAESEIVTAQTLLLSVHTSAEPNGHGPPHIWLTKVW